MGEKGVAITSLSLYRCPALEADLTGQLSFTLNGTPLTVLGRFVRSMADSEARGYIYIFNIKTDMVIDGIIGRFIFQRQVEIMQQLKEGLVLE